MTIIFKKQLSIPLMTGDFQTNTRCQIQMQALSCSVSLSLACGSRLWGLMLFVPVQGCWLRTTALGRRSSRASFTVTFCFIVTVLWSNLLLKDEPRYWNFLEWVLWCFVAIRLSANLRPQTFIESAINTKSRFSEWQRNLSYIQFLLKDRINEWFSFPFSLLEPSTKAR